LLPIFVALSCTNLAGPVLGAAVQEPLTRVASITKAMIHQAITVQAVVASVRGPRGEGAPYTVALTEGGATVVLVYWPNLQTQLAPKVRVGNVVRVHAEVSVYKDRLELLIRNADALDVVTAAAGAAAGPPPTPTETVIGKIKTNWVDRVAIITGTIAGSGSIGNGRRLSVQDATGEIAVVLDQKIVSELAAGNLLPGQVLTVTGAVKLYDGKPAVVPEDASALKFVTQ
jgi:DNA/RNA endonuclease YhcR with UshA esterase domain